MWNEAMTEPARDADLGAEATSLSIYFTQGFSPRQPVLSQGDRACSRPSMFSAALRNGCDGFIPVL
jgi:hypothetical protein